MLSAIFCDCKRLSNPWTRIEWQTFCRTLPQDFSDLLGFEAVAQQNVANGYGEKLNAFFIYGVVLRHQLVQDRILGALDRSGLDGQSPHAYRQSVACTAGNPTLAGLC